MSNFITNGELRIEAERLCDENEALKKLVQDAWRELHAEQGSAQRRMDIADRMKTLGIEVNK